MHKRLLVTAAVTGFFSVALGAFAAHALKQRLDEYSLSVFETGVRYQFYHCFAIALTAIVYKSFPGKPLVLAGNLFIAGIILFSCSLYLLALLGKEQFGWLGAVTPLGGFCFLAAWALLAWHIIRHKQ